MTDTVISTLIGAGGVLMGALIGVLAGWLTAKQQAKDQRAAADAAYERQTEEAWRDRRRLIHSSFLSHVYPTVMHSRLSRHLQIPSRDDASHPLIAAMDQLADEQRELERLVAELVLVAGPTTAKAAITVAQVYVVLIATTAEAIRASGQDLAALGERHGPEDALVALGAALEKARASTQKNDLDKAVGAYIKLARDELGFAPFSGPQPAPANP